MAPAEAQEEPQGGGGVKVDVKTVVDVRKNRDVTRYSEVLYRCGSASKSMTCSISETRQATRTITVEAGLTRKQVALSLGISQAWTHGATVTCSEKLKKGQVLVAYPRGDQYLYKIKRTNWLGVTKSKWKSAFDPNGGITCRVR